MKLAGKYCLMLVPFMIGCTKAVQDTTFSYNCTSTYKQDPFTYITKDTMLNNVTPNEANAYIRATSVNGWYTSCEK